MHVGFLFSIAACKMRFCAVYYSKMLLLLLLLLMMMMMMMTAIVVRYYSQKVPAAPYTANSRVVADLCHLLRWS